MHVEAAGGAEQVDEQLAEGDLTDGALEHRLADGAHGGLEVLHPCFRGHPAALHVELGHLAVVAPENAQQVAGQVVLVRVAEAADDGAIHRDISRVRRVGGIHEDIARVHVGVEEAVAEHLGKKDLHAALGQQLEVGAPGLQLFHVGDRDTGDAFHDEYVATGVVPVHLGHINQFAVLEIAPQLAGVGRLPAQVQLIEDGVLVVGYHLHRSQAPTLGEVARHQLRQGEHQGEVLANNRLDVRSDDLDHYLLAAVQGGGVHLCYRGRGHGAGLEAGKQLSQRLAQAFFDDGDGLLLRERRHLVLQSGELVGDIGG